MFPCPFLHPVHVSVYKQEVSSVHAQVYFIYVTVILCMVMLKLNMLHCNFTMSC